MFNLKTQRCTICNHLPPFPSTIMCSDVIPSYKRLDNNRNAIHLIWNLIIIDEIHTYFKLLKYSHRLKYSTLSLQTQTHLDIHKGETGSHVSIKKNGISSFFSSLCPLCPKKQTNHRSVLTSRAFLTDVEWRLMAVLRKRTLTRHVINYEANQNRSRI